MSATLASNAARRAAYALVAAALLVSIALGLGKHGGTWWQVALFAVGPDLALAFGGGPGLAKGQLHPRAVRAYNLVHRFWGPLVLALLASVDVLPLGFFVGALAWALHIAIDRALGYGLRDRHGFQRR